MTRSVLFALLLLQSFALLLVAAQGTGAGEESQSRDRLGDAASWSTIVSNIGVVIAIFLALCAWYSEKRKAEGAQQQWMHEWTLAGLQNADVTLARQLFPQPHHSAPAHEQLPTPPWAAEYPGCQPLFRGDLDWIFCFLDSRGGDHFDKRVHERLFGSYLQHLLLLAAAIQSGSTSLRFLPLTLLPVMERLHGDAEAILSVPEYEPLRVLFVGAWQERQRRVEAKLRRCCGWTWCCRLPPEPNSPQSYELQRCAAGLTELAAVPPASDGAGPWFLSQLIALVHGLDSREVVLLNAPLFLQNLLTPESEPRLLGLHTRNLCKLLQALQRLLQAAGEPGDLIQPHPVFDDFLNGLLCTARPGTGVDSRAPGLTLYDRHHRLLVDVLIALESRVFTNAVLQANWAGRAPGCLADLQARLRRIRSAPEPPPPMPPQPAVVQQQQQQQQNPAQPAPLAQPEAHVPLVDIGFPPPPPPLMHEPALTGVEHADEEELLLEDAPVWHMG